MQLTFEESLKKAELKKKVEGTSKSRKTLHDFFPVPKDTDQSEKYSKKAISVADYFASSSSHKVRCGVDSRVLQDKNKAGIFCLL